MQRLKELIKNKSIEQDIQKYLKDHLHLIAEHYASSTNEYIIFSEFPIDEGKVDFVLGDVQNKSDWQKALKNADVIVHLAAETGTGQSMYEIERYTDVNIKGTAIMLDILTNEEHSVKKIVVGKKTDLF